ncbi:MAG: hypothetical protein R2855_04610 [Thermomicrobiales bacterium]
MLGFAGLVGARRTDVGLALFGIAPTRFGARSLSMGNFAANVTSPRQALDLGIAYSTKKTGTSSSRAIMGQSISNNIVLPSLQRFLDRFGLVKKDEQTRSLKLPLLLLKITQPGRNANGRTLSGGNHSRRSSSASG